MNKEHPILMSTEMIKAYMAGRKTMTRRVIKPQPKLILDIFNYNGDCYVQTEMLERDKNLLNGCIKCPYGQAGDTLWFRETHYRYGHGNRNGFTKKGTQRWRFKSDSNEVRFTDNPPESVLTIKQPAKGWYKRPSIFLPKDLARFMPTILSVKMEWVQDITSEDCIKEGILKNFYNPQFDMVTNKSNQMLIDDFHSLWDSINGKKAGCSWADNPPVWVIEFERYGGNQ